jgi:hypothetical protein
LVEEAVVEKRVVEVALVEVEFNAVKFWRVVEALTRRLEVVTVPEEVRLPAFKAVAERLVDEALVAKNEVVVALVPVAVVKVND